MIWRRKATNISSIAAFFLFAALLFGCGETFRPIAIPEFPPGPDPQATKVAVALTTQPGTQGRSTHINLAGDTNIGQVAVGNNPIHATTYLNSTRVMVANREEDSLTHYPAFSPLSATPGTISLPAGARPSFVFTNQPSQNMFVIYSGLDSLGIVSLATNLATGQVALGTGAGPVAMTGTPNGDKLYVINAGNNTVSAFNARDFGISAVSISLGAGANPRAITVSSDGLRVFVANHDLGTVSVIDTATEAIVSNVTVGTQPSALFFDARLLRLYVANTGSNSVTIINVDPLTPGFPAVTVPVGAAPASITALADGSRAYVANSGAGTVSVINTLNNTVSRTITVGANPTRLASSADSAKVAVLNSGVDANGRGSLTTINTSTDSVSVALALPAGTPTYLLVAP